jgi:hypothetical protein
MNSRATGAAHIRNKTSIDILSRAIRQLPDLFQNGKNIALEFIDIF